MECLPCADGNAKASDHHEVVDQQLIGGPLPEDMSICHQGNLWVKRNNCESTK